MARQIDLQVVRLRRFEKEDSKLKSFADVAIGEFKVKGFRILDGKNGLYLGMPQEQGKDGRWYSSFYSRNPEAKQALTKIVLAAFQE